MVAASYPGPDPGAGSHADQRYGLAALGASRAVLDVNLYGPWNMVQAFLPRINNAAAYVDWQELPTSADLTVNAVDPDLTATWPGAEAMGARPVKESVDGVIWAATLPDDGPRGGFFRDGRAHPW